MDPVWQPIATAPKDGTLVHLLGEKGHTANLAFSWDPVRGAWMSLIFMPMRKSRVTWDETAEAITHWKPTTQA